jgi:hypothetical protein
MLAEQPSDVGDLLEKLQGFKVEDEVYAVGCTHTSDQVPIQIYS